MMKEEKIDIAIDLHEAGMFPVTMEVLISHSR